MRKLISSLLFLVLISYPVYAETIIYDVITPYPNKIIQIDDLTNIKYIDEYTYSIYLNGSYLGEYAKGDKIQIPDNTDVTIVIPSAIKQKLNANSFSAMIGVGFYAFMQYGVYIVLMIAIVVYLLKRRR